MAFPIESPQNPRIKATARLERRSERDARGVTRVEGAREVLRALEAGVVPVEAFVCDEIVRGGSLEAAVPLLTELDASRRTRLYTVPAAVFARLAMREESGGVVLVVPYHNLQLADLPLGEAPLLCVVEGVEKPGNLGAILRTADAAGVDGVIVSEGATDLHNPNVVRASLGAWFTVPLCEAPIADTFAFLKERHIQIVAADPYGERLFTDVDMTRPVAIVLGAEDTGLSAAARQSADVLVRIPMRGQMDSLNLSTSAALLLYEVMRQRGI